MVACLLAAIGIVFGDLAVTPGWENVSPTRKPFPPTPAIWAADWSRPDAFSWELREGARGSVEVTQRGVRISKTNDAGYIVVKGRPFAVSQGQRIRCFADQESVDADVNYSSGVLRGHGRTENLAMDWRIEAKNFWNGGVQTMRALPCTPPGMPYRKYGDFTAQDDVFTPAIVVSGRRSTSFWTNWAAEDLDASTKAWNETKKYTIGDHTEDMMEQAAFDRFIAADSVHTAEVRRIDGVSRLVVDGEIVAPTVYHGYGGLRPVPPYRLYSPFAGNPFDGSAVKLMVKRLSPYKICNPDGKRTDFKALADDFERSMRMAPNSLFILSLYCNLPRGYIQKYHPEEAWINEKGEKVCGSDGTSILGYHIKDAKQWARETYVWPSYASRVWREWVKCQLRGILGELKQRGLDKRLVGFHPCGYHDGQFSSLWADHSKCAREEYARMIAEPGCVSTNYAFCVKQFPLRAGEEFTREFKRILGRPAVGVMWCESPFMGIRSASLAVTSFCRSDAIDVFVCQPDYRERQPAFPTVSLLPFDSLHLHGKMFWNELDYRTYARTEHRERGGSSPISFMSIGSAADIEMWRTMYRKAAGEADAARMGYWLFDIIGDMFNTPEMIADIRQLTAEEALLARHKPSSWRPDVAIVIDETQILDEGEDPLARLTRADDFIYSYSCRLWGSSGVPHQRYFAQDVLENPSLLDGKKLVVFSFFRKIDAERATLLKRLAKQGVTLVYLSDTGSRGGAEKTGFVPCQALGQATSQEVVPETGVTDNVLNLMDLYLQREKNIHMITPWRCWVEEGPGVKVLARYAADGKPAVAERCDADCRRVYVAAPGSLSPGLLNRLARESGAYVAVDGDGLQIDMNGDFMSVHCLRPGRYTLHLPFVAKVRNLKTRQFERVRGNSFDVELTAGETRRFVIIRRIER